MSSVGLGWSNDVGTTTGAGRGAGVVGTGAGVTGGRVGGTGGMVGTRSEGKSGMGACVGNLGITGEPLGEVPPLFPPLFAELVPPPLARLALALFL